MRVVPTENIPGSSVNGVTTTDLELSEATGMVQLTNVVLTPGVGMIASKFDEHIVNMGSSSSVEIVADEEFFNKNAQFNLSNLYWVRLN